MNIKTTAFGLFILMISCNEKKDNNQEALKSLNEQSLKCIAIMNKAEAFKNQAISTNNTEEIAAYQKTIDSAARENAKIGQQIMALPSE